MQNYGVQNSYNDIEREEMNRARRLKKKETLEEIPEMDTHLSPTKKEESTTAVLQKRNSLQR